MGKKEDAAAKEAKEKKEAAEKAAKEKSEKEAAEKAAKEAADKKGGEGDGDDEGDDDEGDSAGDADKDKSVVKKMIDEAFGKEAEGMEQKEREAMESLGMEAYQAHKDMGANEAEACERAGHALKLAKHMASKATSTESEGDDDDDADDKDKKAKEAAEKEAKEKEAKEAKAVEAARKGKKTAAEQLIEANGRIAALEMRLKKDDVSKYVDAKLAESKLPRATTKKFREAAGEFKSNKDFDTKWALFNEGIKNSRVELDWGLLQEKSVVTEDGEAAGGDRVLNFSAAADEE